MKKLVLCVVVIFLSLTFIPCQLNAAAAETSTPVEPKRTESTDSTDVKTLLLRLDEIKAMDKSELKASERKELRKEVNSLNYQVRHSHGGIYISGGAVIVILLLIILI